MATAVLTPHPVRGHEFARTTASVVPLYGMHCRLGVALRDSALFIENHGSDRNPIFFQQRRKCLGGDAPYARAPGPLPRDAGERLPVALDERPQQPAGLPAGGGAAFAFATDDRQPHQHVSIERPDREKEQQARNYPNEVAGLVLVDSTHWHQGLSLANAANTPYAGRSAVTLFMPWIMRRELSDSSTAGEQVHASPQALAVPTIVLSSTRGPAGETPAARALAARQQDEITADFPGARHIRVDDSGHYIQRDRPDVVVDAARELAGCGAIKAPAQEGAPLGRAAADPMPLVKVPG